MTEKDLAKKDEQINAQNIPIKDKKLLDAYIKFHEKSQELKKWVFTKAEKRMIASKLEWFMRHKAQEDAFFEAEELLKNVNTADDLETLLLKKAREFDEQFENKYYNTLKTLTKWIFENYNLTEKDIKDAITFTFYDYYIEKYLFILAYAYVIKHNLPYSFLDNFNFKKLSNTRSNKPHLAWLEFFDTEYPFS